MLVQKATGAPTKVKLNIPQLALDNLTQIVLDWNGSGPGLNPIYLSSINHEPSILTMRRDGQKRKIIRKMCI